MTAERDRQLHAGNTLPGNQDIKIKSINFFMRIESACLTLRSIFVVMDRMFGANTLHLLGGINQSDKELKQSLEKDCINMIVA
jgi:hypothetical protein